MKLDFIELGKLCVSRTNMRFSKKAPDVTDILPTMRRHGVIVPVLVRQNGSPETFEIVAGARRFHAASLLAEERRAAGQEVDAMPCAILESGDNADAIEASLIENSARLDPDEVTRWECFTRLVREGRCVEELSTTFGLPDLAVRRILALGNLLPRIREAYRRKEVDATTIRHLTMASKSQQKAWLALYDDPEAYCPTGYQLKQWLFGGQSIPVTHALFDTADMKGIVSDLFGEDSYFADAETFWTAQNAAIADRRAAYLDEGWSDVVIVPPAEHFHTWEHEKAPKRKGGRVYIDVRANGEVTFHEGYVTAKEARRIERGETVSPVAKAPRPEMTGPMQAYIDLHRHAALRAALIDHGALALRLMVAHAIAGSSLWHVSIEKQATRNDAIAQSVENSRGEADFDAARRKVLALLALDPDEPTVADLGNGMGSDLVVIFLRLMELDDADLLSVIAVVMGETLASGSAIIEVIGQHIAMDMAPYWQADDAFFELSRDREVLTAMMAEVAGATIAAANAGEKTKVVKTIIRGHLEGADGREKREGWVPRWMAFPPAAYTARGGVGTVDQAALAADASARRTLSGDGPDDELPDDLADDLKEDEGLDGPENPDGPDAPDDGVTLAA
ncbi:MAG: chromosome partitioning protein ParB [Novosphingobium sp. 63-713]|uniref:ParB/RepB/Spo0J family partition protein n=1 Tax=unclassified Novosphingobium TaxID=2644732 RepID=UPI0009639511|nr:MULTISPECIES: ParB/RepB/Spo0J family partition protein [unclassified Novosphingobium]MBN9144614.1 ParB/RepB/Spo0J family partition protein [Novosphingobium sp.]OJX92040.1 MAG: chromosome partitioning protein ParB [Novosphingobium sp. 63-713]